MHAVHDRFADLLEKVAAPGYIRPGFAEMFQCTPVYVDLAPGAPAELHVEFDDRNKTVVIGPLRMSPTNEHNAAVYLHEAGHALCSLLHPTTVPGQRAEVAAWFVVLRTLDETCDERLATDLRIAEMEGGFPQKLDIGLARIRLQDLMNVRLDLALDTILRKDTVWR